MCPARSQRWWEEISVKSIAVASVELIVCGTGCHQHFDHVPTAKKTCQVKGTVALGICACVGGCVHKKNSRLVMYCDHESIGHGSKLVMEQRDRRTCCMATTLNMHESACTTDNTQCMDALHMHACSVIDSYIYPTWDLSDEAHRPTRQSAPHRPLDALRRRGLQRVGW